MEIIRTIGSEEAALGTSGADTLAHLPPIRSPLADHPGLAEVLAGFVKRLPLTVRDILQLTAMNDLNGAARIIHQLRGAAGSYGLMEISIAAKSVESLMQSGEFGDRFLTELHGLIALIRRVEDYDQTKEVGNRVIARDAGIMH